MLRVNLFQAPQAIPPGATAASRSSRSSRGWSTGGRRRREWTTKKSVRRIRPWKRKRRKRKRPKRKTRTTVKIIGSQWWGSSSRIDSEWHGGYRSLRKWNDLNVSVSRSENGGAYDPFAQNRAKLGGKSSQAPPGGKTSTAVPGGQGSASGQCPVGYLCDSGSGFCAIRNNKCRKCPRWHRCVDGECVQVKRGEVC